jgi:hypothetical protein
MLLSKLNLKLTLVVDQFGGLDQLTDNPCDRAGLFYRRRISGRWGGGTHSQRLTVAVGLDLGDDRGDAGIDLDHGGINLVVKRMHLVHQLLVFGDQLGVGIDRCAASCVQFHQFIRRDRELVHPRK